MAKRSSEKVESHISAWKLYKKKLQRGINTLITAWKHKKQMNAIVRIQSAVRKFIAIKKFNKIKELIAKLQRVVKLHLLKKAQAAKVIQNFMKSLYLFCMIQYRKYRRKLKKLREERRMNEVLVRARKKAMERIMAVKRKRAAVGIIEKYWSKHLLKTELRDARKKLKKLPWDCRELWLKLNSAKIETLALKQELKDLMFKGSNT
eukprot:TRINITY_DN7016_c0_g1_i1.p1 TRINITY_DN7016_c0_g1~~TRINITY_DN7016_c0_g1_i1.p1  ORF type:complete len:205 (-),score=37.94 TRINITY_DN7016_c0_g1_i1:15-629(-)